jgi:hypothetical protein
MLRIQRWRDEEDGAAAIFVAFVLVVIFGAGMLAIDAGSLWTTRRQVVTATDSAALAAAAYFAQNPSEACVDPDAGTPEAQTLLDENSAIMTGTPDVSPNATCTAGSVRVEATRNVPLFFAPLFGTTSTQAASSATAEWGPTNLGSGIRPIAVCVHDPHVVEWIALQNNTLTQGAYDLLRGTDDGDALGDMYDARYDHPTEGYVTGKEKTGTYDQAGVVHRIAFEKFKNPTACGSSSGNWGWLCFAEKTKCGASNLKTWLEEGYHKSVDLGSAAPNDEDCDLDKAGFQDCLSHTGAIAATEAALDALVCPGTHDADTCDAAGKSFPLQIFDEVSGTGKSEYSPAAFLGVVLRGYNRVTGGGCDKDPTKCGWFDFEFIDYVTSGPVGPVNPLLPTITSFGLCGIDHDTAGFTGRCDYGN